MKPICAFDVNETLLDLKSLDPLFEKAFGDASVRWQWFSQFIQNAFVTIITDSYEQFGKIGSAALKMIEEKRGVSLTDESRIEILSAMKNLKPHPEVKESLKKLKDHGFTLVTITNSTEGVVKAQIENAGLSEYFDKMLSADNVKRLKPAIEPYQMVADNINVSINDVILIAAHAWDISGAIKAGCKTAFISRPGMVLDPMSKSPDIIGKDLNEVSERIIATYK